jgi:hypothetical protein
MIDQRPKGARARYYGANATSARWIRLQAKPCGVCAIIPRGATLGLRIRRSESIRCSSVSCTLSLTSPTFPPRVRPIGLRREHTQAPAGGQKRVVPTRQLSLTAAQKKELLAGALDTIYNVSVRQARHASYGLKSFGEIWGNHEKSHRHSHLRCRLPFSRGRFGSYQIQALRSLRRRSGDGENLRVPQDRVAPLSLLPRRPVLPHL